MADSAGIGYWFFVFAVSSIRICRLPALALSHSHFRLAISAHRLQTWNALANIAELNSSSEWKQTGPDSSEGSIQGFLREIPGLRCTSSTLSLCILCLCSHKMFAINATCMKPPCSRRYSMPFVRRLQKHPQIFVRLSGIEESNYIVDPHFEYRMSARNGWFSKLGCPFLPLAS